MTKESIKEFLKELTALSQKHSIGIDGCGCCDSPHLFPLDESKKQKKYTVDCDESNLRLE